MIAKGAKSTMAWVEESTWGTEPTTGYKPITFASETLTETINRIMSDEIRSDRSVPNVRGGNISAGGDVKLDMGVSRHGTWFEHLLGSTSSDSALSPDEMAAGAVTVGEVKHSMGYYFVCMQAGTLANGTAVSVTPDESSDTIDYASAHGLTSGQPVVLAASVAPTGLPAGTYFVGVVDSDTIRLYDSYAKAVAMASGTHEEWSDNGTSVTLAPAPYVSSPTSALTSVVSSTTWLRLGANTLTGLYSHTLQAGADFPSPGIAIEKGVKGGDEDFYLTFLGGRFASVDINIPQEGIVDTTWSLLFQKASDPTTSAHSSPGSAISDTAISGHESLVVIGSQTAARPINAGKLMISNEIDSNVFVLNQRYREELPEGRREASGTITTYFKDDEEYTLFKDETNFALCFGFVNTDNGQVLLVELPENIFSGTPTPQVGGTGVVQCSFDFTTFKNTASYDVKVHIIDTNAALL